MSSKNQNAFPYTSVPSVARRRHALPCTNFDGCVTLPHCGLSRELVWRRELSVAGVLIIIIYSRSEKALKEPTSFMKAAGHPIRSEWALSLGPEHVGNQSCLASSVASTFGVLVPKLRRRIPIVLVRQQCALQRRRRRLVFLG